MSEKKILSTITEIRRSLNSLGIYTYYSGSLNSIIAFITDTVKTINKVYFLENHLGYTKSGYPDVEFFVDENSHMIVKSDNVDRFAINSDGHLTITE